MKISGSLTTCIRDGSPINFNDWNLSRNAQVYMHPNKTSGIMEPVTGRETRALTLSGDLLNGSGLAFIPKQTKITFNAVDYSLVSASFEPNHKDEDGTDGGTADNGTEGTAGLAEYKSTIEMFMSDTVAELLTGTAQTATILWDTGVSVSGTFMPTSVDLSGTSDSNNKYKVEGYWVTVSAESGLGLATGGDEAATILTFKDGTTTDKAYSCNTILMSKAINGGVSSNMTFTYNFKINGTLTPTQYS